MFRRDAKIGGFVASPTETKAAAFFEICGTLGIK